MIPAADLDLRAIHSEQPASGRQAAGPGERNRIGLIVAVRCAKRTTDRPSPLTQQTTPSHIPSMSKAFTKESDSADDEVGESDSLPAHVKNYVTPAGLVALQEEFHKLFHEERPKVVEIVSWAAGNGDRSENGDYIYGKKRLREIDQRVRYLSKRIESAELVDPERQKNQDQVFFGATVEYARKDNGQISWLSPVARALMRTHVGDVVEVRTPSGPETVEVLSIRYGKGK